jgi:hypothetical protein
MRKAILMAAVICFILAINLCAHADDADCDKAQKKFLTSSTLTATSAAGCTLIKEPVSKAAACAGAAYGLTKTNEAATDTFNKCKEPGKDKKK